MNITLCVPQSDTAIFTCVVDPMGSFLTEVPWVIRNDNGALVSTGGRSRHSDSVDALPNGNITGRLRVINVTMNDNGAEYRCLPAVGVVSDPAFLTVLGEIIIISSINIYKYLHMYICNCILALCVKYFACFTLSSLNLPMLSMCVHT